MILCIRGNTIIFYHFVIRNAKFFLIERFRLDVLNLLWQETVLLWERGHLPGPESGLLSNSQKWAVRGDMCWPNKRLYWEGTPWWRAAGPGNPGEQLCHVARSLGFYGDGISLWVVFGQVILTQSPSRWHTHCSAKVDASKKDSGRWLDTWCFLNSSG